MQVLRKPEAVWGVRSSLSLSTCTCDGGRASLVVASGRLVIAKRYIIVTQPASLMSRSLAESFDDATCMSD